MANQFGTTVAAFGMAEKGAVNVKIRVDTPGGHSSVPPAHTGSTFLDWLLSCLSESGFPATMNDERTIGVAVQCVVIAVT